MNRKLLLVLVAGLFTMVLLAPSHIVTAQTKGAALNRTLPTIDFTGVTLADALEFIQDVSGANIHVNWRAIEAAGIGKDTLINAKLRSVSLRKVLNLVLQEAGEGDILTYYVDGGVIEITTREIADSQMITRIYPIEDLIMDIPDFTDAPDFNISNNNTGTSGRGGGGGGGGGGNLFGGNGGGGGGGPGGDDAGMTRLERAEALIDVIVSTIQPDIWQVNGGKAAIRFFNGSLIVTAPRSVHEALE